MSQAHKIAIWWKERWLKHFLCGDDCTYVKESLPSSGCWLTPQNSTHHEPKPGNTMCVCGAVWSLLVAESQMHQKWPSDENSFVAALFAETIFGKSNRQWQERYPRKSVKVQWRSMSCTSAIKSSVARMRRESVWNVDCTESLAQTAGSGLGTSSTDVSATIPHTTGGTAGNCAKTVWWNAKETEEAIRLGDRLWWHYRSVIH